MTMATSSNPGATGSLSYTPMPNAFGTATFTVTMTDSGQGAAPYANTIVRAFQVFVGLVNNRPTLDQPSDLYAYADSYNPGVATGPSWRATRPTTTSIWAGCR
jgi:Bacterial Ig domain